MERWDVSVKLEITVEVVDEHTPGQLRDAIEPIIDSWEFEHGDLRGWVTSVGAGIGTPRRSPAHIP